MALFNDNIARTKNKHYRPGNGYGFALKNRLCHFSKPEPILVAFFQLLFFMAQFGFY